MDPRFTINLKGRDYALYGGVLDAAHTLGIAAIETQLVQAPTEANDRTAIVKAKVTLKDGRSFEEHGDASPKNTAEKLQTCLIRLASTRAKGRALRDAVNVGELLLEDADGDEAPGRAPQPANGNGRPKANTAPPPAPQAGEVACENRRCSKPIPEAAAEASRKSHGGGYCAACIVLLETAKRNKETMAQGPQVGAREAARSAPAAVPEDACVDCFAGGTVHVCTAGQIKVAGLRWQVVLCPEHQKLRAAAEREAASPAAGRTQPYDRPV